MNIKYRDSLFLLLLLIISFLYSYLGIIAKGPWMPHMWRQADCLSITMNYFKEGLSFLQPAVHWTGPDGHGKTISEFPLIYFTVAKLWSIFGKHYFIYRGINIILVFSGLYSLYKISYRILNDTFWAFFVPLFLFTSPALVFYTNNFLPNAPALGLALTGTYLYIKYLDSSHKKWIILSTLFFLVAGLLKITSLIIASAFLAFLGLQTIMGILKKRDNLQVIVYRFLPFVFIFLVLFAWIKYTDYYNSKNFRIFLQDLFPIWELNAEQRVHIWKRLYFTLLPSFFNKKALAVIGLLLVVNIVFLIKKGSKYISVVLISFVGILLYILLWYKAFDVHDYYLINLLIIIPLVLVSFLNELKNRSPKFFSNIILKSSALAGLLLLIYLTTMINRLKYDSKDPFLKYDVALKEETKEIYAYKQWNYSNTLEAFETITPYLRSLGIDRNDLVISIPDVSINISLFLMDQKGFTNYGYVETKKKPAARIEQFKKIGAKYLIVNKDSAIEDKEYSQYLNNKIGEYKNVKIYKL